MNVLRKPISAEDRVIFLVLAKTSVEYYREEVV